MVMVITDAICAYYQSAALEDASGKPLLIRAPPNVEPPTLLWVLGKAMPGTAAASRSWRAIAADFAREAISSVVRWSLVFTSTS